MTIASGRLFVFLFVHGAFQEVREVLLNAGRCQCSRMWQEKRFLDLLLDPAKLLAKLFDFRREIHIIGRFKHLQRWDSGAKKEVQFLGARRVNDLILELALPRTLEVLPALQICKEGLDSRVFRSLQELLNPKPQMPDPKPQNLNPKPKTLNPKP